VSDLAGEVELSQMLAARDYRVERQRALLEQYRLPLVSFTMNIAGPVKNSPSIRRGFLLGKKLLLGQLRRVKTEPVYSEEINADTGCEGLYVVDMPPEALKSLCCALEEQTGLGRLFDLDVLTPEGNKLDRPHGRVCLLCGRPAKDCARSRTHSVPELQAKTREIIRAALDHADTERAATLAVRALLYEVSVTPKPGLVDRLNSGSHRDMDTYTFLASAAALWPYFAECVRIGRESKDAAAPETFAALRFPGKLAEGRMRHATGGVNTHKGAIFTFGLVCGALGRLDVERWAEPAAVLAEVAAMTKGVERELQSNEERTPTAGERFFREYGVTGVRGQAAQGFPSVLHDGLPALEAGLAAGRSEDEAGAAALLTILAHTPDTNMLSRGGFALAEEKRAALRALLQADPYPDFDTLEALDREYRAENLSPGGSADLLALCWLLHFLKEDS
jgi:holo-ACP synthase/triphosphoribosyl-dephospho-CoA synthase